MFYLAVWLYIISNCSRTITLLLTQNISSFFYVVISVSLLFFQFTNSAYTKIILHSYLWILAKLIALKTIKMKLKLTPTQEQLKCILNGHTFALSYVIVHQITLILHALTILTYWWMCIEIYYRNTCFFRLLLHTWKAALIRS
jgi:hypothetical protein